MNADSANKAHLEEVREGGGQEEEKPKFNMDTLTSFYNSSDNQLAVSNKQDKPTTQRNLDKKELTDYVEKLGHMPHFWSFLGPTNHLKENCYP